MQPVPDPVKSAVELVISNKGYKGAIELLGDTKNKQIIHYLVERDYMADDLPEGNSTHAKEDMGNLTKTIAIRRCRELEHNGSALTYLADKVTENGEEGIACNVKTFLDMKDEALQHYKKHDIENFGRQLLLLPGNAIVEEFMYMEQYDQAARFALYLTSNILGMNDWDIKPHIRDVINGETKQEARLYRNLLGIIQNKGKKIKEIMNYHELKADVELSDQSTISETFDIDNYYFPVFTTLGMARLTSGLISADRDFGVEAPDSYRAIAEGFYTSLVDSRENDKKLSFNEINDRVNTYFNFYGTNLKCFDSLNIYEEQPLPEMPPPPEPEMPPPPIPIGEVPITTCEEPSSFAETMEDLKKKGILN